MSRNGIRLNLLAVLAVGGTFLCGLPVSSLAVITGSPHDFSSTGPYTQSTAIAGSGVCSSCHVPHGAADPYAIWSRDLSGYRADLANDGNPSSVPNYVLSPTIPCYDCHDYHEIVGGINNDPDLSQFHTNHQPQNIAFGFTKNGTGNMTEDSPGGSVSGYYENNPPAGSYGADPGLNPSDNTQLAKTGGHYFKYTDPTITSGDTFDVGDKLPCRDCHDPHAWSDSPTWQAFLRQAWPGGSTVSARLSSWTGQASTIMANAPPAGGGSRSDGNSRTICIACHGNSDTLNPVNFDDISQSYSNATSIVRPPATVSEHADASQIACVSCHNHNSIDTSCNGCHSFPGLDNTNSGHQLSAVHARHVGSPLPEGTANSREFDCTICHFNYSSSHNGNGYSSGQAWGPRSDYFSNVNISFDPGWNPGTPFYSGDASAMGACTGLYCHGNGGAQSDWAGTSTAVPPKWDNTVSAPCGSCHGTGSSLANANHPVHLDNTANPFGPGIDNAACGSGGGCHTAYGLSPTTSHVDNTINFRTSAADSTPVSLTGTGICANCHSTATAGLDNGAGSGVGTDLAKQNWNDNTYKLPCLTCHNNTLQGNSKIDGTGTSAPNIEAYWLTTGHGAGTAIDNILTTTVDIGVDPPIYQNVPVPCGMCHDITSRHYGTTLATGNAWRLRTSTGYNDASGGLDKFCNTQCHGSSPGSYVLNKPDLPQDHTWILSASETKESGQDTHPTGADVDTAVTDPPQATDSMPLDNDVRQGGTQVFLCVTCHDPHGIGASVSAPRSFTGTNASAADNVHMLRYIHDAGSVLCKKCHI